MSSLLKKYPSDTIQQAGEKYTISGDTSDLSNILKKQTRVYKTISPELQQKLQHMKSDIVDNLQMPEHVRDLEGNHNSISLSEKRILFKNHSLLKKYPSKVLQQAGEKYRKGDASDLSNILQEKPRKYKTLSPETKQKLHYMKSNIIDNIGKSNIIDNVGKSNIVDNLQMSEYVRELKNKRESLISDLHKRMLDNVLEIANHNNITDINEDDITIKNGKLYLCGVMFYGNLLDKEKRTKEYLSKPKKILEDGHIKAFDALIKITKKLFGDNSLTYPYPEAKGSFAIGIFPGRRGKKTALQAKAFCDDCQEKNKEFFDEMTSIISGINLFDSEINSNDTKYMDICSIPLFVDSDKNVFYYDQFNRRGLSGISTNPYEIRTNMYEYEFLS